MSKNKSLPKGKISLVSDKKPSLLNLDRHWDKVATKIVSDEEKFMPRFENSSTLVLKANLPEGTLKLSHRTTAVIDCGISINLSEGYKVVVRPLDSLINRGLYISSNEYNEGRIKVYITNIGKEIIVINNADEIAKAVLERSFIFELEE